jgi:S1-C subfamily serine protease
MGLPPDTEGYLVLEIAADGPADKGGIRGGYKIDNINGREIALGGDIIVGIDNMTVTTPENVVTSLKGKQAGDTVQLDVIRNGQTNRVELTLGEIPQAALQGRQGEGQQPGLEIIP